MEIKQTISRLFFVPTLNIPREALKENNFINAYIGDCDREVNYENSVYLLFQPLNTTKFRHFLDEQYEHNKLIVEDYDYSDGYVVVVYKLNEKWKKDFDIIRTGKYSTTSKEFQKLFPRIIKAKDNIGLHKDELSLQLRIFNKTPDLRQYWENKFDVILDEEDEVWEGWDEKNEMLNINSLINDSTTINR